MSKKKHYKQEDTLENVEYALSRTEKFIEDNQKTLIIVVLALIILVGGFWTYKKVVQQPRETKAQKEAFYAQLYFERDSFSLAVNGDGINPGFLDLIDEYGGTKIGKLSRYYAGISYLRMGNFDEAISYLKKFDTKEPKLKSISMGAIGDCYSELGNPDEAISWYSKAAAVNDDITAPFYLMKQGVLFEQGGQKDKALNVYQIIKDKYKTSGEAQQVDKYITRVSLQ